MDAPFYTSDLNIPLKYIAQSLRTGRRLTKWLKLGFFAVKVSPFGGEYSGGAMGGKDTSCGWGWYEPILVGGLTYIGRHRDLYSFVVGAI